MAGDWFKFYEDTIHDPKLLKLSDALYRAWTVLLCFASKNGGTLPPADDIATALREKPAKVAEWISKLKVAGLFDHVDGKFIPHNWEGRQYKVADPTAAERMSRYRKRKGGNVTERNVTTVTAVTELRLEEEVEIEEEKIADAVDARKAPLISAEAISLTEKLLVIAGHDLKFWPPGWCGAPMRVQTWLAQGWQPEIIMAAVTSAAARKRGPPANSVNFFENAVAEEVARQAAPLPTIEIRQAEKLVTHGPSHNDRNAHSLVASIKRELDELEREESADPALTVGPLQLLSDRSVRRS